MAMDQVYRQRTRSCGKYVRIALLLLVTMLGGISAWGQVDVTHKSGQFYVEPGTEVHIQGSLISLSGNADPISNLGKMYISDSVTCYGDNRIFGATPDTTTAEVILNGDALQQFTGTENMRFGKLTVRNAYDSLHLFNRVEVYSRLLIDTGNIDVNADTLDLLQTGYLVGENSQDRIFSGPYGRIKLNRPLLLGNTYPNIAGVGLGLQIDGNLGSNVSIYRGNIVQTNVSNGSIERFYFFDPQLNGDVSQPASEYWDSTELAGNQEEMLQIFLSNSSGVNWTLEGGTADTIQDKVTSGAALAFVMTGTSALILAEGDCDSLPPIAFPVDTLPLCGPNASTWLVPNGITGMISQWSNGTQNQDSIQVLTPGTYVVAITDISGCQNEDSVVVVNAPVPSADFAVTPICFGDTSLFRNQSSVTSGNLTYHWDLNDVYTSGHDTANTFNTSIIYTNPGTYTATLTATTALGCVDTFTRSAIVSPYPVADFTVANNCADSLLVFANNSTVTPSSGLLYHWDFGNGDTAIVATPAYSFPSFGTQSIVLTATSNGCSTPTTRTVTIHPNPQADFTYVPACENQPTPFTNTSQISSGSLTQTWTFLPTTSSTLANPQYTFPGAGSYPVNLEISSGNGCTDDTTITVVVNPLPQPTFTAVPTCQGDAMQFNNGGPAISTYQWNFNGAGQSTVYNPQFTFASAGPKSIVLIETDVNGCVDSTVHSVTSKPAPVAGFSVSGNCEADVISFLNTSATPFGAMNYQWGFGDQNASTLASPNHIYAADGTYPVQLVAENDGCYDTLVTPVTVDSIPLLNLGGTITTCDSQYVFDAGNPGSTYLWSNGSTNSSITAIFSGSYAVSVTNAATCSATDTVSLTLNSVVIPQLGPDDSFCDFAPLDAGYPGAAYAWSNGATTQTIQPTTSGSYAVTVTDQNACVGSDTIQTTIFQTTQPNLGPDLNLCNGVVQTLDPQATGVSYSWNTGATSPAIDVTQSGLYAITLIDNNGCTGLDSIDVIFAPNPVVDLGADTTYCDAHIYDLSQADVAFLWSTGATTPVETITTSGAYSVLLTHTLTGCESRDSVILTIAPTPLVNLGVDTILCSGTDLLLDAGNPGLAYNWNVGSTQQTLVAASSGSYVVEVTSGLGCIGTDSIDVVVTEPVNTDLGADFTLCLGTDVVVSSPIFGGTYAWSQNGMLLSNTDRNLVISDFGTYVVEVMDSVGCMVTDTVVALQTGSQITAEFLVSTIDLFAGDTLQFVNLSFPAPFSSYWSFGDGAFSIGEDPRHTYLSPGDYSVSLEVTNGICSSTLIKAITVVPKVIIVPGAAPEVIINDFARTVLYPNPNRGTFTLEIELLEEGELKLACVDMLGRVLLQEAHKGQEFKFNYNELQLAAGLYLLNMQVSGRSQTIRFIVQ